MQETESGAKKTENKDRNGWGRNQPINLVSGSSFGVPLGSKRRANVLSLGVWLFGRW